MSDADKTDSEARPGVAIAGLENTLLRLTFWQTILSIAGVFTGVVALYAALNESEAVRQQTAASVWPYVQLTINDTSNGESASFELSVDNVGVGPALMRDAQVTYRGAPQSNWQSVVDAIGPNGGALGIDYGKSSLRQRVLAPGESLVAFQTGDKDLALSVQAATFSGELSVTYCYCSIFDECWVKRSGRPGSDQPSKVAGQCPDFGEGAFTD